LSDKSFIYRKLAFTTGRPYLALVSIKRQKYILFWIVTLGYERILTSNNF